MSFLLAFALAGCATNSLTNVAPGGAAVSSGAVVASGAAVGAVAGTGAVDASYILVGPLGLTASIALGAAASNVIFGLVFASVFLTEGLNYRPPATMDEGRVVHAQDCTKPIENTGGNLKCLPPAAK